MVYAESNLQLAGLLDVLPRVFPNSKIVFMIRDGRDWARSWFNGYFAPYGVRDPFRYFTSGRANARMFADDPFYEVWGTFSHFQKICWLWRFHTEYALKTMEVNSHTKLIRYEDLFEASDFEAAINDLLEYLTKFPSGFKAEFEYKRELSDVRFHESRHKRFPKWDEWDLLQVRHFQEICGSLMESQGYGKEPRWLEMIAKANRG